MSSASSKALAAFTASWPIMASTTSRISGVHGGLDALELVHQLLVHMEPAGGVQEHHVVAVLPGVLDGGPGDVHRVGLTHLEHRNVQLSAHHLQLLDGGGAVDIAGGQQGRLPF